MSKDNLTRFLLNGKRNLNAGLTVDQVLDLRTEAGLAGDLAMVAICNDALKGDQAALSKCAEVITLWEMSKADDARASE